VLLPHVFYSDADRAKRMRPATPCLCNQGFSAVPIAASMHRNEDYASRDMSPKSILITGCSSGIGRCCAIALQRRGYSVFATARKESDIRLLQGEGLTALYLDYTQSRSIQKAFEEVMRATGGTLYALFNNGAYGQPGAVEDLTRDVLRSQFEANLFGWHELTQLAVSAMRRRGEGRIIHNSSILGFAAMSYRGAYNASKFALEGLADTQRLELRGSGIHISLIEPGPVRSRFRANAYRKFVENIDTERSVHRQRYEKITARLQKQEDAAPFTLPPEAVLKRVVHALESKRPKIRYYVTVPTYLIGYLKRILSGRQMDRLLAAVGK
jgi:NAD(P)-dependent dehydrogenase (short-subunit alcohol dehydrogenase family)